MPSANELLTKWMAHKGITTLSAAAKALHKAGHTTPTNWRSGYAKPEDETIVTMCEQCGESPEYWLGRINADFAKSAKLRKAWTAVAAASAGAAASATALAAYIAAV